jgi:hypothetical protein
VTAAEKVNSFAIVVVVCSALFAFFTFAATRWIGTMEREVDRGRERDIRISTLEHKIASVDNKLGLMNSKLDKLVDNLIEDRRGRD